MSLPETIELQPGDEITGIDGAATKLKSRIIVNVVAQEGDEYIFEAPSGKGTCRVRLDVAHKPAGASLLETMYAEMATRGAAPPVDCTGLDFLQTEFIRNLAQTDPAAAARCAADARRGGK